MKQISLLLMVLLFIPFTFSQEGSNNFLKELQSKFDSINDLEANVFQSINDDQKLPGKLFYKKDNKFKLETDNNIIVSNGKTSWNYSKKENKVIISSNDDESVGAFSIQKLVYEYPYQCQLHLERFQEQKVLTLIPCDSSLSFSFIKLFIDQDYLIAKILVSQGPGALLIFNISDYVLNKNIPDSKFSFTSPEGCKVIDLR
jgi:outer membrane lipoprotein-sorting protein